MYIYRIHLPEEISKAQAFWIETTADSTIQVVDVPFPTTIDTDLSIDYSYHKTKYGFPLSGQEIRDFLAHRNVWEVFLESGEPGCWIVESNVRLHVSEKELLETTEGFSGNKDLDLFFPYEGEIGKINGVDLLNFNEIELRKHEPYLLGYPWGNSIYWLTRKGASVLLQLDKIEDRLDNILVDRSFQDQLNTGFSTVKWFDKERDMDRIEWPERMDNMGQFIRSFCFWTKERKMKVRLLLKTLSELSQSSGIPLILQAGTHLGYVRMGGILPWDDDVDLGIEEKNLSAFLALLGQCSGVKFRKVLELSSQTDYYKVWLEEGEPIEGHDYTFPFIDIWVYNPVGNDLVFWNGMTCPNSALYALEDICFEGFVFQQLGNTEEVLDSRYVDWKTMIRVYPWSHRLEKVAIPRYDYPMALLDYL